MATINSYTNIEQSRKLAEILPIESADMKWFFWREEIDAPKPPTFGYSKTAAESYKDTEAIYLPCWSLAALLGVLPKTIDHETLFIETSPALWHIGYRNVYTARTDNPVDACVAMIEKLHELKML